MIRAKIMTTSLTVHIKEIDPESEHKQKSQTVIIEADPKGSSIGAHTMHTKPSTSAKPSISSMMRIVFHTKIILTINVLSR